MTQSVLSALAIKLSTLADVQFSLYRINWDKADLDACIFTTQTAVDIVSGDLGASDAHLLFDLGVRLNIRFGLSNTLDDLDGAISGFQRAVELTSDEDPNQVTRLNRLSAALYARFNRIGDFDNLDAAIAASFCAIVLAPDDARKPALLSNHGLLMLGRFRRTGKLEDVECAIAILRRADALMRVGHPDKPPCLDNLGISLSSRFESIGELKDLDEAISCHLCAIELTPDGHPAKPLVFCNLGSSSLMRFRRTGELEDLERAISTHRRAVELTPDGHPDKPPRFNNLGNSFFARFERTGALKDLEEAISLHRRVAYFMPDDHPDKVQCSNNLGTSLFSRFEALGKLKDLEEAISCHRRAVELMPDGHRDKPSLLSSLGNSFLTRCKRTGELEDLERAISTHRRAMELTPDGHPDKPSRFVNLGNSFHTRFGRTGALEDLERAVSAHRRAVELTPDDHPNKPLQFNNLGTSFVTRFERTGELEDLEQAMSLCRRAADLTPDDHPDKPTWLNSLGNSYVTRFERTGELEDIEQAMSLHRRAVELTPDGHADKPSRFNNLGNSSTRRFERTGALEDLEQAISTHRRALELTPEGHPKKPLCFSNLGNSLATRFGRTGELQDINQAILSDRRAVELTPDHHPTKPLQFNNLGISFIARFQRTGELEDLEQAISVHRRAVELTPDVHPSKPSYFHSLGSSLFTRFEHAGELEELEQAILLFQRASKLRPTGHSHLFVDYDALARCFQRRFEHSGDNDDINKAISLYKKAAELMPEDQPYSCNLFSNLGSAQRQLFMRTQSRTDFDAAIESFIVSTLHSSGSPDVRFGSARQCVAILSENPTFSTTDSLLSAHSRMIAILPVIVWLGHGIHRRYEESSQLGELVSTAVSDAIAAGALTQAVEWLEAGRVLIWAQVLSLRTPLDELQASLPNLAEQFQSVQARLQSSAYSAFAPDVDAFVGIAGLTVNSAADSHRGLAIEYDSLMKKIRACPGFDDFLRPKKFESIVPSLSHINGPVVFINVQSTRCDALILFPGGDITSVDLPDLSSENVAGLLRLWLSRLVKHMGRERGTVPAERMQGYFNPFTIVLERLWLWVVCPVLVALDLTAFTKDGRLPHITWCPTGWLAYLPLHAAGIYNDQLGPRIFDFVVSSYTPSLAALLRSCEGVAKYRSTPELLLVTQPATPGLNPLPGTARESAALLSALAPSGIRAYTLDDKRATVRAVRDAISHHSWVHLACHGSQELVDDPTQSAFMLHDGRLSLAALMGTVSDNAEVAFLSACQTAVGHLKNPEESAHLAAAMLAVGFKAVIGTTWSIRDDDAPVVVGAFYKELLALRSARTLGEGETGAAYALHEATRVLREKVGENSFMRWVPFVHFGV